MDTRTASTLAHLINTANNDNGETLRLTTTEVAAAEGTRKILELREALDTAMTGHINLHREMLRVLEIAESGRVADAIGMLKHALTVSHS